MEPVKADINLVRCTRHLAHHLGITLADVPPVFPKEVDDPVKPLATGTREALVQRFNASRKDAGKGLKHFVANRRYLSSIARTGAHRHNLEGLPVEPVSPEHAQQAKGRLLGKKRSAA